MHFSMVPATAALLALLPATIASPRGLYRRDSATGQCGAANGGLKCDASTGNTCCSVSGWCGDSSDHCGTGCQSAYGTCSGAAPSTPTGGSTSGTARPKPGNVPYGTDIYACTVPGTVAVTFDDGPYIYTTKVLDLLKAAGARATFFVTGNNLGKGAIDTTPEWSNMIKRMESDGHQIASHTWTHQDLSAISEDARRAEMTNNEAAIRNIIGKYPTYMRPPYSSCTGSCPATMGDLGYHITYFDVDTDDYNQDTPATVQNAVNNYNKAVDTSPNTQDFLVIAHDIHQTTADTLVQAMLDTIKKHGYKAVTVGECLGDPKENWYRS